MEGRHLLGAVRRRAAKRDGVDLLGEAAGEFGLGGGGIGPRAVARLESFTPPRPLPKIFRMVSGGQLIEGIFKGDTINTPSMLCVEDYLDALRWGQRVGGLDGLVGRADRNAAALDAWVRATPWIANLAADPAISTETGEA